MRVIVTRPRREAQRWVQALAAAGHEVLALPLIEVAALADLTPLRQAWQRLGDYAAVMFVSANAVSYFFASKPVHTPANIELFATELRAWATGPGTAAALLQAGVPAAHIDAPPSQGGQFDSEALWRVVAGQVRPGQRVLIARGDDAEAGGGEESGGSGSGRDWLANKLTAAGARPEFVVAYRRRVPDWLPQERALASAAADDQSAWVFSSSQAVRNLQLLLPTQRWQQARAVATHARIADVAQQIGFGTVQTSRPDPADLVASIELMR